MKKTNFFYVDETGHINNDSSLFIYGCMKTDTPKLIEETLDKLKNELAEDAILREFGEKVLENNFHATGDPFDIRTAFFRLLPYLNFRAYFTVLFKNDEYYRNLKSKNEDYQIIESLLRKILIPRITKNKNDINKFYFETLEVEKKSLKRILDDIFSSFSDEFDLEYFIVEKENPNIPVIDYVNFLLNKIFTTENNKPLVDWISRTFEAVKDKIALIHFQNDDSFYSRLGDENHLIEIKNIKTKMVVD